MKCQICKEEEASWSWQPFGPDDVIEHWSETTYVDSAQRRAVLMALAGMRLHLKQAQGDRS